MNKDLIIKTDWDLASFFGDFDIEKIKEELKVQEESSQIFVKNWKDKLNENTKLEDIVMAILDYEKYAFENHEKQKALIGISFASYLDQSNEELKKAESLANEIVTKIANEMLFFDIFISTLKKDLQESLLSEPKLFHLKHYLEKIFESGKFTLSEKEEKIMNLTSQNGFENWIKLTEELLSKEAATLPYEENGEIKTKVFTINELYVLYTSTKKEIRDPAAEAQNKIIEKHLDVAVMEMNSILYSKKVSDELRGISRPDLPRHIDDDVSSSVVDTMIDSVSDNFEIPQRFFNLKAKMLGLSKMQYHEKGIPFESIDKIKFDFDKSAKIATETFYGIDKEFGDFITKYLENGQFDVYPKKGKYGGGFCATTSIETPILILLNHNDKLHDASTIAHEMGHALQNEYLKIKYKNNVLNFDTGVFMAEVSSTFFEDLMFENIIKSDIFENVENKKLLQLECLMTKLGDDVNTIFRQVACYRFEQDLHREFREKNNLSAQDIGTLFRKNMKNAMGDIFEYTEQSDNWWLHWSHIRNFFYVYSYASGLLISKYMQSEYRKDKNFVEKVKQFFSSGTDKSPEQIFADLGININDKDFWLSGINEIKSNLETCEKLAKELEI